MMESTTRKEGTERRKKKEEADGLHEKELILGHCVHVCSKKRCSLSTFLTYQLSNTSLSVAYSSRVAKLDLLQIYDAFINTSLLVESITDMCRVNFF